MTHAEFKTWYEHSLFWTQAGGAEDDEEEAAESMYATIRKNVSNLSDPELDAGSKAFGVITIPLLAFFMVIPDCRLEGMEHKCYGGFVMSIVVVAILSYVMVDLAEIFGATVCQPPSPHAHFSLLAKSPCCCTSSFFAKRPHCCTSSFLAKPPWSRSPPLPPRLGAAPVAGSSCWFSPAPRCRRPPPLCRWAFRT